MPLQRLSDRLAVTHPTAKMAPDLTERRLSQNQPNLQGSIGTCTGGTKSTQAIGMLRSIDSYRSSGR